MICWCFIRWQYNDTSYPEEVFTMQIYIQVRPIFILKHPPGMNTAGPIYFWLFINIMSADVLVPLGTRTSADIILIFLIGGYILFAFSIIHKHFVITKSSADSILILSCNTIFCWCSLCICLFFENHFRWEDKVLLSKCLQEHIWRHVKN